MIVCEVFEWGPLSGTCPRGARSRDYLQGFFRGANARQAAELKKYKKIKKCVLSFSVNATKRPTGVRNKKENKREGSNMPVLLEAFAGQFIGVGENDVRPRLFQSRWIGGQGRG